MPRLIPVAGQKGGVGKTTTAMSLAAVTAQSSRVLLVDVQPQPRIALAGAGVFELVGESNVVTDIDATAEFFAGRTGPVKDAVQPGRRITTLRHRELGMSVRTAMISARP